MDSDWQNRSDWGNSLKSAHMISSVNLKKWGIIYEYKDERNAKFFIDKVRELGKNSGFEIDYPIFE